MNKGFQLYYAGSQNKTAEQYLLDSGCNRLASQLLDRNVIGRWVETKASGVQTGKLFIDSGAFSAHTRGAEVDVDAYCDYLNSIDDQLYVFAQVDKIPGVFRQPKTHAQVSDAPKLSWENYLHMRKKLKSPEKLLPIFHQGEAFSWLKNMLEWVDENGNHIGYIGLSPANDVQTEAKRDFISKCFDVIKDSSNPDVKTHAFGMTSLDLLEKFPFTSADSTTWILIGAMGSVLTKWGPVTLSSSNLGARNHLRGMPKEARDEFESYVVSHGFTVAALEDDYKQRIIFNIKYLKEWAENYQYKPVPARPKTLF